MQRKLKRLHFIGIGGIGMAGLAELMHAQGFNVSGTDLRAGPTTDRLREIGIAVTIGHAATALGEAQAVVVSSAIPADNPELIAAAKANLPRVGRGELLAELMRTREGIGIAGSHGKTTTSAMAAHILESAGLDPTALIGGRVPRPGGSASPAKLGQGDLLVAELDESDGSFLLAHPVIAVVTNIDPEHLDHHGSYEALLDAFARFANGVPFWGRCILGVDHPGCRSIQSRIERPLTTYALDEDADLRAHSLESIAGGQRCRVRLRDGTEFGLELPMPGRHNIANSLAAIAVALELGVEPLLAAEALEAFPGVARRFDHKGETSGIRVVDDYAHHPAEVQATLAGARSIHPGRITAVFQPHRFSRTRDLWDEFAHSFSAADRVVIADVYPAGEAPIEGVDGAALTRAVERAGHPDVLHGGSLAEIEAALPARLERGDLVLTLGAGDVVGLGPKLLAALAGRTGSSGGST